MENFWEPLDQSWPLGSEDFQFGKFDEEDSFSEHSSLSPSSDLSHSPCTENSSLDATTRPAPVKRGRKVTAVLPRKDRNKASALKYRQRKKEYTGQLETQVAGLVQLVEQQQKELHDLRTENKIMTQQLEFIKSFMSSNMAGGAGHAFAPSSSPPPQPFAPFSSSSAPLADAFTPPFSFGTSPLNKAPPPRLPDASTYYSLLAHPAMYLGLLGCCLILAPTLPATPTSVSGTRGRVLLSVEGPADWQLYFNSLILLVRAMSILIFYVGLVLVGGVLVILFGSRVRSAAASWISGSQTFTELARILSSDRLF